MEKFKNGDTDLALDIKSVNERTNVELQIASKGMNGKGSKYTKSLPKSKTISDISQDRDDIVFKSGTNLKFNGQKSVRITKRTEILDKILSVRINDEKFNFFIEELINLEESLIA